jgi:hypothetical protein
MYLRRIIEGYCRAVLSFREKETARSIRIFTACATEINPKQSLRVIHQWKFSFAEVDAGRLKHNNEVVIPRPVLSREPDGRERERVSSN